MKITKLATLCSIGLIAGGAIGFESEAHATTYRIMQATGCQVDVSTTGSGTDDAVYAGMISWAVYANVWAQAIDLYCSAPADSTVPMANVAHIYADVVNNTGGTAISVGGCVTNYDGSGGACGTYANSSTGSGASTLTASPSAWNTYTWDYPFVVVVLPAYHSGYARITGYSWST